MSLFRLPKLPSIASTMRSIRGAFSHRSNRSVSETMFRRLLVDPLEERQLLSLAPADMDDILVNHLVTGNPADDYLGSVQYTDSQQAIAVDNDGDFVVAWTRQEEVLDSFGNPIPDPETGENLADSNIYARYFTDEVQRITLPEQTIADNNPDYGRFSLQYGYEIQKISITATYKPFVADQDNISGEFHLGFDDNGNGIIDASETTHLISFDETNSLKDNAEELQQRLTSLGGALTDAWVEAVNPHEYLVHFGESQIGQDQPEIRWVQQGMATFSSGFLPAVTISTVENPFTIADIPVSPDNPEDTARAIENYFLQTSTDFDLGPIDFPPENRVNVDGPYSEPLEIRTPAPSVSVTPVDVTVNSDVQVLTFDALGALPLTGLFQLRIGANTTGPINFDSTNPVTLAGVAADIQTELNLFYPEAKVSVLSTTDPFAFKVAFKHGTGAELIVLDPASPLSADANVTAEYDTIVAGTAFDITFTGTGAKRNHPLMVISAARDDLLNPLTIAPGSVVTLKESSDEFRVNPVEVDNPFTLLPDVYDQTQPVVAMDSDGDFVIAWNSEVPNSRNFGSFSDIYSRQFAAVGSMTRFTEPTLPNGNANPDYDPNYADNYGLITPGVRALITPETQLTQVLTFDNLGAPPLTGQFDLQIGDNTIETIDFDGTDSNSVAVVADDMATALENAGYQNVLVTVVSDTDPFQFRVDYEPTFGTYLGKDQVIIQVVDSPALNANITVADQSKDFYTFRVNQDTTNPQFDPTIAMDELGNFVIGWANGGQDLSFFNGIKVQQFDRDGVRLGNEFLVNYEDTAIHIDPYVAVSHAGNFVVAWSRTDDPDYLVPAPYTASIQAKAFDTNGNTLMAQFNPGGAGDPSVAFDMDENFVITWDGIFDSDNIGTSSGGVQGRMYELFDANGNVTGAVIRDTFRVNSATFDTSLAPLWPLGQGSAEAALDADGDLAVAYDGFGADSSEDVFMDGHYFEEWLDLVFDHPHNPEDYFDPRFEGLWPWFSNGDVDGNIEYLLIRAQNDGATDQELGQLRAYLDQKAGLLRGEANGVLFSRWDADPQLGTLDTLYSDSVVNAYRDGHNARFIIEIDSSVTAGSFVLGLSHPLVDGWEAVDISPVFVDNVLQVFDTMDVIDAQLEAATRTGVHWAEDRYEGPVDVRVISTFEVLERETTYYALGVNPSNYIYEVTFQGEVHDTAMSLWTQSNDLTAENIAEIQMLTFTADDTGEFYLSIGGVDSPVWNFDPGNLIGMGQLIESWLISIGYGGAAVISPPEGSSEPFQFQITFGGASAGVDQPPIVGLKPADSTDPYSGSIFSAEIRKGAEQGAPAPFVLEHTSGSMGTVQEAVSIGMEPDGDFATAWTQNEEFSSGFISNENVYYRRFDENTDTAGPRLADLIDSQGNRIQEDVALTTSVQYLVLTFDEEMMSGDPAVNPDSILNPENFKLLRDGIEIPNAIYHVEFGMNMASELAGKFDPLGGVYDLNSVPTNKWEAVLILDGNGGYVAGVEPLIDGHYTIESIAPVPATDTSVGNSGLRDAAGNPLEHTGFEVGGEDLSRDFDVHFQIDHLTPGTPADGDTDQSVNTNTVEGVLADGDELTGVYQFGDQNEPAVARNAQGDYVAVWVDYIPIPGIDGDGNPVVDADGNPAVDLTNPAFQADIVAQRFNASSHPIVGQFVVNSITTGNQIEPDVAIDNQGEFVVTWSGEGDLLGDDSGVFAQWFAADGTPLASQFRVNQWVAESQEEPAIAMDAAGNFVIVWTSYGQDGDRDGVYARRYNAAGQPIGGEFRVNTTWFHRQDNPDVAMDAAGNFTVIWSGDGQDGSAWGVFGQRYNAAGAALGGEFRVNQYTTDKQIDPRIAMDAGGNAVVTWASFLQDGSGYGVYARRYDNTGAALANEFRVNQTALHWQTEPSVGLGGKDLNGDGFITPNEDVFVITWTTFDQENETTESNAIFARLYNGDGSDHIVSGAVAPLGEFRVNALIAGDQVNSDVSAIDDNGEFVVLWVGPDADGTGVFSRLMDPPLDKEPAEEPVEEPVEEPTTNLSLVGTAGNDKFQLMPGATPGFWTVVLNGVVQNVPAEITSVSFDGLGGDDKVIITGSAADETIELWPNKGTFVSNEFTVEVAGVTSILVDGGGGEDVAILHDSDGNDVFSGTPTEANLSGDGFYNRASAFRYVHAYATAGDDVAKLYDSAGDDTFIGTEESGNLYGDDFYNRAKGFRYVHAYASAGTDVAKLYDSAGKDVFVGTSTEAKLYGKRFYNRAKGFDSVNAYASAGIDVAKLYDSAGDDTFVGTPTEARLYGDGFYNRAKGFRYVHACTSTGADVAKLYDSAGDDTFVGTPTEARLYGDDFYNRAKGFRYVHAYATTGGSDVAKLFDSAGNDVFIGTEQDARLYGDDFYNRVKNFRYVHAIGGAGGDDLAELYGSEGNDIFSATPDSAKFYGENFYNRAKAFGDVRAYATPGGNDKAYLYDSALDDLLEADENWASLSNEELGFANWAIDFARVRAISSNSGDVKDIATAVDFLVTQGLWEDL